MIEIGCGPGAAARAVADRLGPKGHVLAVDRSARSIAQLTAPSSGSAAPWCPAASCSSTADPLRVVKVPTPS